MDVGCLNIVIQYLFSGVNGSILIRVINQREVKKIQNHHDCARENSSFYFIYTATYMYIQNIVVLFYASDHVHLNCIHAMFCFFAAW